MAHPGDILCERCGYCLHGLTTADLCPECSKPAAESMPARRIGSPWQRGPGVGSFFATFWRTLARPRGLWDDVRVERPRANALLLVYLALATLAWSAIIWSLAFPYAFRAGRPASLLFVLIMPPGCIFVALYVASFALWVLLTMWGKQRGWRASVSVVDAVVAHASAAALLGPLITAAMLALMFALRGLEDHDIVDWTIGVFMFAQVIVPLVVAPALGLRGLSRMRFANRPRKSAP